MVLSMLCCVVKIQLENSEQLRAPAINQQGKREIRCDTVLSAVVECNFYNQVLFHLGGRYYRFYYMCLTVLVTRCLSYIFSYLSSPVLYGLREFSPFLNLNELFENPLMLVAKCNVMSFSSS